MRLQVINPATAEPVAELDQADREDADRAGGWRLAPRFRYGARWRRAIGHDSAALGS